MPFPHASDCRHDLPGRAVAALQGVVIEKRLLHRMQRAIGRSDAFYGRDALAMRLHGKREAGDDAAIIHMHRARAALPVVTALLRAAQTKPLSQRIEERGARI